MICLKAQNIDFNVKQEQYKNRIYKKKERN